MKHSQQLVLLFGMPRSGTTWLGKIYDSHPDVHYLHEPDTQWPLNDLPLIIEEPFSVEKLQALQHFVQQLVYRTSLRVNGKLPVFQKSCRGELATNLYGLNIYASKILGQMNLELPLFSVASVARQSKVWVWKSIESVGRMGAMLEACPNAAGVLLVRHPCGHVASVLSGQEQNVFSSDQNIEEDMGILKVLIETSVARDLGLSLELLRQQTPAQRIAWRWRIFNEVALRQLSMQARSKVLVYEDLCTDPVGVTKNLFEDVGLAWNDQTESFVGASVQSDQASYYGVFKDPLKSANKWRSNLDASTVEQVMEIVEASPLRNLFPSQL